MGGCCPVTLSMSSLMHSVLLVLLPVLGVHGGARSLPSGNLIVGYAFCGSEEQKQKMIAEAMKGVNVLIWFASSLVSVNDAPHVRSGPTHTCVAEAAKELRDRGLNTTHMIS